MEDLFINEIPIGKICLPLLVLLSSLLREGYKLLENGRRQYAALQSWVLIYGRAGIWYTRP